MAGPDIAELYAIFKKCRALSESERATFLDSAVKEASVRRQIERLLEIDSADDSFPCAPVELMPLTIDQPITEKPGTLIGPYKLLQQIGEGGMGVVHMAEQTEPVERKVALKIIKPGMDTRQVIARFEAEEQALALMDHPNIAKVLDAGTTESGRPYFVMELVRGITITEYCDQQRLTPRKRLELFIPICQAVQHAHQKGIVHRDIKPSNILVALYDGQPVPKVIDFGVAKATEAKLTEKTMFTRYGQVVGTLEYMSPEQANLNQLDIDTRSDIYSLGVLLYELLTGCTPFDKERLRSAAFDETLRIIREEEPPKPSTRLSSNETLPSVAANRRIEPKKLSMLVRGELDWIVMKALEKDRARRYETASGFADDIRRYVNDEPVVACPPSATYRFRKFARRNRGALTTGAVVFVALAVGIVAAAWQARQALLSRDRALQAEDRALQAEDRAVKNLERALNSVDKMLTRVADETLANVPFMGEVRRGLLEDALSIYQQLLASAGYDARTGLETVMAQRRLGTILFHLGRKEQAAELAQATIELLTSMLNQSPDDSYLQLELARTEILQSRIDTDHSESSIAHLEQAAEILDQLSKKSDATREVNGELAFCLSALAVKRREAGDRSQSDEAFQGSERIYAVLLEGDGVDPDLMVSYAKHLVNWGGSYEDIEDWQTAEAKYREAVDVIRALLALDQRDPQTQLVYANALGNVAHTVLRQDDVHEADSLYREAIEILQNLVRDYPSFPDYRLRLAGYLMSAGAMCSMTGETKRGIQFADEAVERLKFLTDNWPTVRKYQSITGAALCNLASLLRLQGDDLERAEQLAKQSVEHQLCAIEDPESPNLYLLKHYLLLALIQMQRGSVHEAHITCDEGLEVADKLSRQLPDNVTVSMIQNDLRQIKQEGTARPSTVDPP